MTALNSPIPISSGAQQRGSRVDDFVERLSHPVPVRSTGAFFAAFQCLISFGLLPLVLWPARWAEFLDGERQDLLDLTAWWRRRVSSIDAAKLDKIARRFRRRPILMVLPWLAVGFNAVLMALLYTQGESMSRLWDLLYQHPAPPGVRWDRHGWPVVDSPLESHLYSVWILSLGLAYLFQWYAVRSHAAAVQSLVQWTNKVAAENGFVQVRNNAAKVGMHWLWILLAVVLCSHGAWWGIPMVFAGAMQQRYAGRSSPLVRVALAGQARDAFAIVQNNDDRFCSAGHCGARLPAPARFCPRCGTAV